MIEQITEIPFLKSIGVSGLIAVLGGLVPLLGKMGIVTSVTSSHVEKLLFTKEKRFYIGFIRFILLYILAIFLTSFYTYILSEAKLTIQWANGVAITALVSLMLIMVVVFLPESTLNKFRKSALVGSLIVYILHILCLFFIIPLVIIATLYETLTKAQIHSIFTEPVKYQEIVIVLFLILCVANLLFLTLSYLTTRQFFKKFNLEKYYIKDTDNTDLKWFIYHPVDKEHILLGNEAILGDATEFKIEETKKILTGKIYRYRKPRLSDEKINKKKKKKKRAKKQTSSRRINNGSFAQTGRIHRTF